MEGRVKRRMKRRMEREKGRQGFILENKAFW